MNDVAMMNRSLIQLLSNRSPSQEVADYVRENWDHRGRLDEVVYTLVYWGMQAGGPDYVIKILLLLDFASNLQTDDEMTAAADDLLARGFPSHLIEEFGALINFWADPESHLLEARNQSLSRAQYPRNHIATAAGGRRQRQHS